MDDELDSESEKPARVCGQDGHYTQAEPAVNTREQNNYVVFVILLVTPKGTLFLPALAYCNSSVPTFTNLIYVGRSGHHFKAPIRHFFAIHFHGALLDHAERL